MTNELPKRIGRNNAIGRVFLSLLTGVYEVTGTDISSQHRSRYKHNQRLEKRVREHSVRLTRTGRKPEYYVVDEHLIDSYSNCSQTYLYSILFFKDAKVGGKIK